MEPGFLPSDLLKQYDRLFLTFTIGGAIEIIPQDREDIEALLDLL